MASLKNFLLLISWALSFMVDDKKKYLNSLIDICLNSSYELGLPLCLSTITKTRRYLGALLVYFRESGYQDTLIWICLNFFKESISKKTLHCSVLNNFHVIYIFGKLVSLIDIYIDFSHEWSLPLCQCAFSKKRRYFEVFHEYMPRFTSRIVSIILLIDYHWKKKRYLGASQENFRKSV